MYALPNWGTSFYPKVFATVVQIDSCLFNRVKQNKQFLEMRMKGNVSAEPKTLNGVNGTREEIRILTSHIKGNNIVADEKERTNAKNIEENDKITEALQNLRLEPATHSSDESEYEDEEISADMVAKCPTRTKDKLKENNKAKASPYPSYQIQQSFHSESTHTGGYVTIDKSFDFVPNIQTNDYIPESVVEHSNQTETLSTDDIDLFVKGLLPEEFLKVDEAVKLCEPSDTTVNEPCSSPHDSGCGTLSPASVPSPYALHSPNPNIPPPKYDSSLSSVESDSSYLPWDFEYAYPNETNCQFSQDTTSWVIPHSQSQAKVKYSVSLPLQTASKERNNIVQNITKVSSQSHKNGIANDFGCNILEAAPVHSLVLNRSKNITQTTPPEIFSNVVQPSGEPVTSLRLKIAEEPKQYTQLMPVNRYRNLQSIRPGGVSVSEVDLGTTGVDRLRKMCTPRLIEVEWTKICLEKESEINAVNDQSRTKLMQTLQERPSKQFLEKIFSRVQRIKKDERKELLQKRDKRGHTALYMAALLQKDLPVLARYIADSYVELNLSPNEIYGSEGNSLLHIIAGLGDSYAQVLADLLHVNGKNGEKAFDVNRRNNLSLTALHIAATSHSPNKSTLTIAQLLVKNGATIKLQNEEGRTALHLAIQYSCDSVFIKALLQSPHSSSYVNIPDHEGNTPLHICAARNDVLFDKQKEVIMQLITSGASHNTHNRSGKFALSLVAPERKQEVKNLLNRKQSNL
ncbi:uncharacterized protein isoform X3 [Rhodnius prolixus]|uniref:uncharacterized protein isoform X3 n=1 Tax=Rhodnius prolixus TaxID=13249 RepID=UPI003D18DA18